MTRGRYLSDATRLLLLIFTQIPVHAASQSAPRITRQQLRQMVEKVAQEKDPEVGKVRIRRLHEKYDKSWLEAMTRHQHYQSPGQDISPSPSPVSI